MAELLNVLDEQGNKTGIQKNKKEIHEQGLWHSAVHIWIYNSKGEILLQKRAEDKDYWPGMWDISTAGHISAGETPEQTAIRELEEELGIKVDLSKLKFIGIRKFEKHVNEINYHNKEFDYIYLFRFDEDASKLKFKDKEVEKVKFVSIEQLEKDLKDPELSKKYVPHGQYYFDIFEVIEKELSK
ncbi:MAG: NUDIX domain-containing protein [Candidatus Aenigmarchaeota archaeon]|nr:NUDIX domain-containing protein [Candidatus Aenigmarchaeota archaeon]